MCLAAHVAAQATRVPLPAACHGPPRVGRRLAQYLWAIGRLSSRLDVKVAAAAVARLTATAGVSLARGR